jgi:transcription-repair coupling factor (superfamily II helicase)
MAKAKKETETTESEYNIGDIITHTKFGIGEVINVIPGEAIKVRFGKQEKILLLKYNTKTLIKN